MFLFVTFYSHTNPWDITQINKKTLTLTGRLCFGRKKRSRTKKSYNNQIDFIIKKLQF